MERLDQVVVGARSQGLAAVLGLVLGQQEDDRGVGRGPVLHAQPAHDREAVDAGKVGRDQNQRRPVRADDSQSFGAIAEGDRLIPGLGKRIAESPLDCRVGIYY
jgi:hypothetical protein